MEYYYEYDGICINYYVVWYASYYDILIYIQSAIDAEDHICRDFAACPHAACMINTQQFKRVILLLVVRNVIMA